MTERYSRPVVGNTVRLRMFVYNSNLLADVVSIDSVNIYVCDPGVATMDNPAGNRLVAELDPSQVVNDLVGSYYIDLPLLSPQYAVGKYHDSWEMTMAAGMPTQVVENEFRVYPQMWYSSPVPVVYDFSFDFQPNKIRKGSRQYLRIRVTPNVPKATDIARYYENLAIAGDITVTIEQKCGRCLPDDCDLRVVVEDAPVDYKERCFGYYFLDTCDLEEGVYGLTFSLELGGNRYRSDMMNLQIYS